MLSHEVHTPLDVAAVLETSGLLEVSEFRVFELAYGDWYGVAADEPTIERHFVPYMFGEEVPPWVRAFTRRVLALEEAGELVPHRLGIERESRTARGVVRGVVYTVLVVASTTVLVLLAKVTAERLGLAECLFPPCF